jgi:hypothetical protein
MQNKAHKYDADFALRCAKEAYFLKKILTK